MTRPYSPFHFRSQKDGRLSRRLLLSIGAGAAVSALAATRTLSAVQAANPPRGGTFRVAVGGGGASESLNPLQQFNEIDILRMHQLYERLVAYDANGAPQNQLAQEFSSNRDATVWKIKIRSDVIFHDGSKLTADDVVYSLRLLATNPTAAGHSDVLSAGITPNKVRRLDQSTVEVQLTQPSALLSTALAARTIWIFKERETSFSVPNGTGPFKYKSFTPGANSVFVRHSEHRKHSGPYIDSLEVISFSDTAAAYNALLGGTVDALLGVPFNLIPSVQSNPGLQLLRSRRATAQVFTMAVDEPPFNDIRVRQAFRLLTDRNQLVENALASNGVVGNDLFSPTDPDYASSITQRGYDPDQAKALLRSAAKENPTVSLYTSPGPRLAPATLFIEQAKRAGVKITLNQVPSDQYFNSGTSGLYLKAAFAQSAWTFRPLTTQFAQTLDNAAQFNETHWHDPKFEALAAKARTTLDRRARHELWLQAQQILWDQGGYIVWGFSDSTDGLSAKVRGLTPSVVKGLGGYDFRDVYLA